jgi:hypothetical protein
MRGRRCRPSRRGATGSAARPSRARRDRPPGARTVGSVTPPRHPAVPRAARTRGRRGDTRPRRRGCAAGTIGSPSSHCDWRADREVPAASQRRSTCRATGRSLRVTARAPASWLPEAAAGSPHGPAPAVVVDRAARRSPSPPWRAGSSSPREACRRRTRGRPASARERAADATRPSAGRRVRPRGTANGAAPGGSERRRQARSRSTCCPSRAMTDTAGRWRGRRPRCA